MYSLLSMAPHESSQQSFEIANPNPFQMGWNQPLSPTPAPLPIFALYPSDGFHIAHCSKILMSCWPICMSQDDHVHDLSWPLIVWPKLHRKTALMSVRTSFPVLHVIICFSLNAVTDHALAMRYGALNWAYAPLVTGSPRRNHVR